VGRGYGDVCRCIAVCIPKNLGILLSCVHRRVMGIKQLYSFHALTVNFETSQVPVMNSKLDYQSHKRWMLYSVWSTANLHLPSLLMSSNT
jgi:hypothetical protein